MTGIRNDWVSNLGDMDCDYQMEICESIIERVVGKVLDIIGMGSDRFTVMTEMNMRMEIWVRLMTCKMGIQECDMAVELEVGMRVVELGMWKLY